MNDKSDNDLIDQIIKEMDRVWGDEGLGGSPEEYQWLLTNYRISEEDDVKWQLILQESMNDLPEEDAEDPEVMEFLDNDDAVHGFLIGLLEKYQSSTLIYPENSQ